MRVYVFGYGSLAAAPEPRLAELRGVRRTWGVAMDNRRAIPGYKVYRDADGAQPAVFVAFLDLVPAGDGAAVNGVLLPATEDALAGLDARERNYAREDVTELVEPRPADGRVLAYTGSAEGRARLAEGAAAGTAVVQRAYLELVEAGFARLGDDQLARYRATTDAPSFPVAELTRVDL